jgi:uroporphyrinogen III methyltransferase/synthase
MGVGTAAQWSAALIKEKKSPATPVAIVRRCSWPDQMVVRCTLGTVAEAVAAREILPPAVILVGEVVATTDSF